ncbi:methyltransferase [Niastella vici]|uniref:Methyltransferase n=1 Tax=Niastella vici TaxID=1703345 RepID=A0A1V9G7D1_9BACT|nr:class I SAM-dependent methyltransferase [Niastella vici]OQP66559.1 methyltransferase [Niastella vici]
MTDFWEKNFREKQEMWGSMPANSAIATAEIFYNNGFNKILIPGIGYGRNAQPFINKGMEVTGIEISNTAMELAEKRYGKTLKIHHGSVTDMPFDSNLYDGIFCHALIHLLDEKERTQLIADCYNQLTENGIMVFTTITKHAHTYGQGTLLSKDRYEQFGGVKMFFYDENSIQEEFTSYGLCQVDEIVENYPFYLIQCRKKHMIPIIG